MNYHKHMIFAILLLVLALIASPALAQDGNRVVTDNEVNEVAKDLYCPVCENTPLDVCGTQACADWRDLIRTKLAEGQSEAQIFDYFARQYGDGVLANPPGRGMSLVVLWVLPVVLLLVGLLFFGRYVSNLRAQSAQTAVSPSAATSPPTTNIITPSPASNDDYIARVEQELQRGM